MGFVLGFKLLVTDNQYLNYTMAGKPGLCVGMCVTWMLDILEEKEASLRPPSIARGQACQRTYQAMGNAFGDDYKAGNKYMFKAVAYSAKTSGVRPEISRTVEDEMADTHMAS